MMVKTNTEWVSMTNAAIVNEIGSFIKHKRLEQNKTQSQLAKEAGLNRWTLSKIENGDSITLSTLIQLLRALDTLYVLNDFKFSNEISPIEYAKLQKKKRQRASSKKRDEDTNKDLGW